jgi:hypothetical protein
VTATNRCLDGETLAAWVEGGLTRNDAAMAEAHVSSCPRCQEIAGLIVKTAPAVIVEAPWWRRRAAWLVPASVGVAAVGLLMIAPADPILAPAAPVVTTPPATAVLETAQKADAPAAPPVAPAAETKLADRTTTNARPAERQVAEAKKERRRDEGANAAAGVATAPAAAAPPATVATPAPASGRVADQQSRQTTAAEGLARRSETQAGAKAAVAPDGSIRWRITDRGTLERSTDGGTAWQAVNVGVTATFTTVQAPEPRTAVVTTADGRQFRTTDAGATWQLVAPKL